MLLSIFIHLKGYEHIARKVRRHYITLIPAVIVFFILFSMPLVVSWLIFKLYPSFQDFVVLYPLFFPLVILGASIYYLSMLTFFYSYFLDFYLDLLVVTNDRLVDIEQIDLFARRISELDLFKIEDITSEVKGIVPSIFNYGTLTVQTAGAIDKFIVRDIPHPERLRREILDFVQEDQRHHPN